MILAPEKIPFPSDDKRWRLVATTMRRLGYKPHALIEALHTVQETFGYIDEDALKYLSRALRIPLSQVYGVATFYHYFSMKPQGKHTCVVCMGTACYIKGTGQILNNLENAYSIKAGETTPDGGLSLLTARCLGACGIAPAVVLDGVVIGHADPAHFNARVEEKLKQ
ncbi:MAG: bidirectional hydrogenase complex protein HoxE [Candidatus Omnitrophica bacterium]|jgi:NADH dehydrogenase subunit E (EC 1.6.5.3)|nr:bidirectional hydrogenase complex protein HoxE [bacterium]MCL4736139.1 bidirectional hydrogenase complex protein HoxE [Candidatus Omnitrophota bacterium]NUP94164.1 bidirectional hydrogenase complex protein HoxE [Candidatus Omnitrophota bacterium]